MAKIACARLLLLPVADVNVLAFLRFATARWNQEGSQRPVISLTVVLNSLLVQEMYDHAAFFGSVPGVRIKLKGPCTKRAAGYVHVHMVVVSML